MHMQAIVTKFHGPTNTRGARISAKAYAGRVTVDYEYALNPTENHAAAAKQLAVKMGWNGMWVSGGLPSEDGDVFVRIAPAGGNIGAVVPAFTIARDLSEA